MSYYSDFIEGSRAAYQEISKKEKISAEQFIRRWNAVDKQYEINIEQFIETVKEFMEVFYKEDNLKAFSFYDFIKMVKEVIKDEDNENQNLAKKLSDIWENGYTELKSHKAENLIQSFIKDFQKSQEAIKQSYKDGQDLQKKLTGIEQQYVTLVFLSADGTSLDDVITMHEETLLGLKDFLDISIVGDKQGNFVRFSYGGQMSTTLKEKLIQMADDENQEDVFHGLKRQVAVRGENGQWEKGEFATIPLGVLREEFSLLAKGEEAQRLYRLNNPGVALGDKRLGEALTDINAILALRNGQNYEYAIENRSSIIGADYEYKSELESASSSVKTFLGSSGKVQLSSHGILGLAQSIGKTINDSDEQTKQQFLKKITNGTTTKTIQSRAVSPAVTKYKLNFKTEEFSKIQGELEQLLGNDKGGLFQKLDLHGSDLFSETELNNMFKQMSQQDKRVDEGYKALEALKTQDGLKDYLQKRLESRLKQKDTKQVATEWLKEQGGPITTLSEYIDTFMASLPTKQKVEEQVADKIVDEFNKDPSTLNMPLDIF